MSTPDFRQSEIDTRAGRSWIDLPYLAGEPCVCCRLNGTLGYHHDTGCPACAGSGIVKDPTPIARMLGCA